MPEYTYACLDCKRQFDIRHSITSELGTCPECGGILERVINFKGHVRLKGAGFHRNDYPSKEFDRPENE